MPKVLTALEARNNLGAIIDEANSLGTHFFIKKRNKKSAVVLSNAEYLRLRLSVNPVLGVLQEEAKRSGLDKMTEKEIEAEINAARREQA